VRSVLCWPTRTSGAWLYVSKLLLDDTEAEKTHLSGKLRELADRLEAEPDSFEACQPGEFAERFRERADAWDELIREEDLLPDAVDPERVAVSHLLERAESKIAPGEEESVSGRQVSERIELLERSARYLKNETGDSRQQDELDRILRCAGELAARVQQLTER
jgi:hypothetical protein